VCSPRLASTEGVLAALYLLKEMGTVIVGLETSNIQASLNAGDPNGESTTPA
jgi:hypothetical protein